LDSGSDQRLGLDQKEFLGQYVSGFISPPLPDQFSPVRGVGVAPVKQLDEGLLGATSLVLVLVAVGFVSPAVEQNSDKAVHHSFLVKGMLQQSFLGSNIAPSPASSSALASSGTSEALAATAMVSVGPDGV
jgi:hypothetical protein